MKRLLIGMIIAVIASSMLFAAHGGRGARATSSAVVRKSGTAARSGSSLSGGHRSLGQTVSRGRAAVRRGVISGRSHSTVASGNVKRAVYNGFSRNQRRRHGRSYWSSRWNRYYGLWPNYGWGWWYNDIYYDELEALCEAYPDAPPCQDLYY